MEFRFRAKENRDRPLPPSVFFDKASQVDSKNLLPEGQSMEELERELKKEKIIGEIIALRIMRKRMLKEEEEELKKKRLRNWDEDHESKLSASNMYANITRIFSSSPFIKDVKEIPTEVNIPTKNSAFESLEVEQPEIIREWSCALCDVSVSSQYGFNNHVKGNEHLAKVSKLYQGKAGTVKESKEEKDGNVQENKEEKALIIKESKEEKDGNVKENKEEKDGTIVKKNKKEKAVVIKKSKEKKAANNGEDKENKGVNGGELSCNICHVSVTSKPQLSEHLKGKKHLANMRKLSAGSNSLIGKAINTLEKGVQEEVERSLNEIKLPEKNAAYERSCTLCNIRVTSETGLRNHLNGKKHLAKVKRHGLVSEKEVENSIDSKSSSNGKAINAAESKENVKRAEILHAVKEDFPAAEDALSNV